MLILVLEMIVLFEFFLYILIENLFCIFFKLSGTVGGGDGFVTFGSSSKNDKFVGESSKNYDEPKVDEAKEDDGYGGVKEANVFEYDSGVGEVKKDSDKVYIFYFIFLLF